MSQDGHDPNCGCRICQWRRTQPAIHLTHAYDQGYAEGFAAGVKQERARVIHFIDERAETHARQCGECQKVSEARTIVRLLRAPSAS